MKKLIICVMAFAFALGLTACGGQDAAKAFDNFNEALDLDFAKEVNQTVASFGDDKAVGMRSAGSPAEKKTCDYLEGVMKDIGLQNVTVDEATVDTWTFKGANITFTNAEGKEQKIDLGAYQMTMQADNQQVELVDVGQGTIDDYEGLDVAGKLVLFDVDQENDWWINYPAYQAKAKGALGCVAMRVFEKKGPDRIGVQDYCGPADCPALAISRQDATALRKAIKKSGGDSITVTLNADSTVKENGKTHNLYGEIPGEIDETIFVFAHMDGYFHAIYDDAQGVAVTLAQAKALIDSGYEPHRTIRFCIHGAEEWGREGSEYDWSTGAYEEIENNHPDWTKGAIAIVNNDGGYSVAGENCKGTMSSDELIEFVQESLGDLNKASETEWSYDGLSTYTEDFYWTRKGVPAISAGDGEGGKYDAMGYHSTYDSWEAQPVDDDKYMEFMADYGKLVIDLDNKNVRPMDFTTRLTNFKDSLSDEGKEALGKSVDDALAAAESLEAKMADVELGADRDAAMALNEHTQEVYLALQDSLLGLDFMNVDAIIRHDMYEDNIENLDAAIDCLKKGDLETAFDEYLSSVDWSWYDMYFDKETCKYMKDQLFDKRDDTWGSDLIEFRHADTGSVVRSLKAKMNKKNPDVSKEIKKLKKIKKQQEGYLVKVYAAEKKGLEKATNLMLKYSE